MFAKLSTLVFLVPFVSALTINPLTAPTTGGSVTITWTATTQDPSSFSIELNNEAFHNSYAIANNVPTAQGSITFTLPQVTPGDGYTIEFVAPNNIGQVYAETGDFAIGAATSTSTSAASTTSSSSSSTSSGTATSSTSVTPLSSISTLSSVSTSASSSAASASPSNLNSSGAAPFKLLGVAPAAALVLSAIAGAVMVF